MNTPQIKKAFTFCALFSFITLSACVGTTDPATEQSTWALEPPIAQSTAHASDVIPLHDDKLTPTSVSPVELTPQLIPPTAKPATQPEKQLLSKTAARQQPESAIAPGWAALIARLSADGHDPETINTYFYGLADYAPSPMAVKVEELFRNHFLRTRTKPAAKAPSAPLKSRIYKGFVTTATVEKCNAFLKEHATAFRTMEQTYGVPKEIIVSLLFVETKLGGFMGKESAFWSLAAMAATTQPEQVKESVTHLPINESHDTWLQSKLTEKSDWAYNELSALITHCRTNNLDPQIMPGSVYGAIGICQFMPSNLKPYSADGNNDGIIDVFTPADAIHSAAKYLKAHGWKSNSSVDAQRNVIKRYNNLTVYANTILTLAESVRTGVLQTAPPDAPKATPAKKKAAPKKKGTKKSTPTSKKTTKK